MHAKFGANILNLFGLFLSVTLLNDKVSECYQRVGIISLLLIPDELLSAVVVPV